MYFKNTVRNEDISSTSVISVIATQGTNFCKIHLGCKILVSLCDVQTDKDDQPWDKHPHNLLGPGDPGRILLKEAGWAGIRGAVGEISLCKETIVATKKSLFMRVIQTLLVEGFAAQLLINI